MTNMTVDDGVLDAALRVASQRLRSISWFPNDRRDIEADDRVVLVEGDGTQMTTDPACIRRHAGHRSFDIWGNFAIERGVAVAGWVQVRNLAWWSANRQQIRKLAEQIAPKTSPMGARDAVRTVIITVASDYPLLLGMGQDASSLPHADAYLKGVEVMLRGLIPCAVLRRNGDWAILAATAP